MKYKELIQMAREDQGKKLSELELELIKLNAQVATGTPPKNAGQLKRLKKDIARIMLIMSEEKRQEKKVIKKENNELRKQKVKRAQNPEQKTDKKQTKQNE